MVNKLEKRKFSAKAITDCSLYMVESESFLKFVVSDEMLCKISQKNENLASFDPFKDVVLQSLVKLKRKTINKQLDMFYSDKKVDDKLFTTFNRLDVSKAKAS